jgi:MFS family permease
VLILSLITCIAINIDLTQQTSFPGLVVLRCLQSCAASGKHVFAVAIINDIIRPAERKVYSIFTSVTWSLAPLLAVYWHSILVGKVFFDCSCVLAAFLVLVISFNNETCHAQIGDGSVPPKIWNYPLMDDLWPPSSTHPSFETRFLPKRRLTPV